MMESNYLEEIKNKYNNSKLMGQNPLPLGSYPH